MSEPAPSDGQARLFEHLTLSDAYRHQTGGVTRLDTHISCVFLTGRYAYKVKKAVALDFLDFRTLESRRHFCEEEVRLNRRLAPEMYLGVVPISGTVDRPEVEGSGLPIEYAVKMREFPQQALLSALADRGALTSAHIDTLASEVAAFHRSIAVAPSDGSRGTPAIVEGVALDNFRALRGKVEAPADLEDLERIRTWTASALSDKRLMIQRRLDEGYVRECHGDLHLANMALIDGHVTIFDGIEFNERMRWIDVMSEIAFAAMDLQDKRQDALAHRFLNRYLELTGDYSGAPLLPLYLSYRAMVRAKVSALRSGCADRTYIDLALRYTHPAPPFLIVMHGVSGSGKTSCSQLILESLGAIRIRTDVERRRQALGYGEHETTQLYRSLARTARDLLTSGSIVIVDGAFLKRWQRDLFRDLGREMGTALTIVAASAPLAMARSRVADRARRGDDASEADLGVLDAQVRSEEPLGADETIVAVMCDTSGPIDAHRLVAAIAARQAGDH